MTFSAILQVMFGFHGMIGRRAFVAGYVGMLALLAGMGVGGVKLLVAVALAGGWGAQFRALSALVVIPLLGGLVAWPYFALRIKRMRSLGAPEPITWVVAAVPMAVILGLSMVTGERLIVAGRWIALVDFVSFVALCLWPARGEAGKAQPRAYVSRPRPAGAAFGRRGL
jgi:uncharacterized membrane protein YhaH (DUF805 family)